MFVLSKVSCDQPVVNIVLTQAPSKSVTPSFPPHSGLLFSSVKSTSNGILREAACTNHHPIPNVPIVLTASTTLHSGRPLMVQHSGRSGNTRSDLHACAPASCDAYADVMFDIYAAVMAQGLSNFLSANCPFL